MGTPLDFLNIMSGLGAAVDIGTNLWKTKYNYDMNQRDFDYQKSLQEQIFQREDTAVQRRMADLQAAGLNPNLAAGSAAGAGSVVSRSSTNDLNPGSVLDSIMAVNQLKLQQQEVKNKKLEGLILKNQEQNSNIDSMINQYLGLVGLGYDVEPNVYWDSKGSLKVGLKYSSNNFDSLGNRYVNKPYYDAYLKNFYNEKEYLTEQLGYLQNSNKYLEKELNWQTAKNFADMIGVASNFVPKVNFGFRR